MKDIVNSDRGPKPIGPYSQAVRSGSFLFCSGQIPLDPKSGQIVPGDIAAQTRRVMDNIAALCGALGHPERQFASIVIAGTNGKGSVTVMVETALRAAGHRVARYTSPHLVRIEERFVIDGREVSTEALRDALGAVRSATESLIQKGPDEALPTFLEFS